MKFYICVFHRRDGSVVFFGACGTDLTWQVFFACLVHVAVWSEGKEYLSLNKKWRISAWKALYFSSRLMQLQPFGSEGGRPTGVRSYQKHGRALKFLQFHELCVFCVEKRCLQVCTEHARPVPKLPHRCNII